jgi:hypothetical protein
MVADSAFTVPLELASGISEALQAVGMQPSIEQSKAYFDERAP